MAKQKFYTHTARQPAWYIEDLADKAKQDPRHEIPVGESRRIVCGAGFGTRRRYEPWMVRDTTPVFNINFGTDSANLSTEDGKTLLAAFGVDPATPENLKGTMLDVMYLEQRPMKVSLPEAGDRRKLSTHYDLLREREY